MDLVECVVIGAGAVGIAIARSLAANGREVLVLETEHTFGLGNSSRNSEVIHAGIYYLRDSLKAKLCVEGKERLFAFCDEYHVPYKTCGKLIVATNEDEACKLPSIAAHARANGVNDIVEVEQSYLREMEPSLFALRALLSPRTAIVDSYSYMLSMIGHAENSGAIFAYQSPLVSAQIGDPIVVSIGGPEPMQLSCHWLINCGGLSASRVASAMAGFPKQHIPDVYFAKGNYFSLTGARAPFSHLIYPVPVKGGLGTHLTFDLAGQARFGPDVEWVSDLSFQVDATRVDPFYDAVRRYWPELPDNSLVPAYAGIRPKVAAPDAPDQDFIIAGPASHGVSGVVQLFGIESPGLTSSLAIAEYVNSIVGEQAAAHAGRNRVIS